MSYINKQTTIYEGDVYITGSQDPLIYGIGNLNIDGNFNINNRFSISDTSNSINSTTASFTVYGGFSINSSQNATSYTSGGCLTIAGGLAIGRDTYIGGILNMNSNKIISLATCTDLYDAVNKYYVDSTLSSGFSSFNVMISNATINNLVSTNISSGTISANSLTIPNSIFTNISSGTISTSKISANSSTISNLSTTTFNANNVTITGDLIVSGSTVSINTSTVNIANNLIMLNAGPSGIADSGFIIHRYQVNNNIGTGDVVTDTIAFSGLVQSGTTTSQLVLPGTASTIDSFYNNYWVKITSGIANNNVRQIINYVGSTKTATLNSVFTATPSIGSDTFNLYGNVYVSNYFKQNTKEYTLSYSNLDSTINDINYANLRLGKLTNNLITTSNVIASNASIGNASITNFTATNIKVTGTTSVSTPINASDAVTKAYVDNNISNVYYTVSVGTTTANMSTSDALIPDMSLITNIPGVYSIHFNSEYNIPAAYNTVGFSTVTATSDLNLIYNDINALTQTQMHILAFGSGETLFPGVYNVIGAMSIAGTLTLDGQGNSNSLFVIRGTAAFNTTASAVVTLINGAQSKNVYWVAQDAIGLGAGTDIKGLIFSNSGAIAVGADCIISGRLFTKTGAIAFGPGVLSRPIGISTINLRSLENFIIFTGFGGVSNAAGVSTYTGDISTNSGAITGFSSATVNGTIYQAGSTTTITEVFYIATFSLYVNNVLIPHSYRTRNNKSTDISLQGVATVINGDTVQVRYRIDNQASDNGGKVNINNRILTITKIN